MSELTALIRKNLLDFQPYSSARMETKEGKIWLNANELPWNVVNQPGSKNLNRYPQKQPNLLVARLAQYYRVNQNQVLVTRGSDEGIDLLVRLFCEPTGDGILICPPTFGMYAVAAKLQGANVIRLALKQPNFELDVDGIIRFASATSNTNLKLIFLCSPNNPTGNLIEDTCLLKLCDYFKGRALIVVDEAYIEFSASQSVARYMNNTSNLVVLRTLSKAFGLAAARIGCVIANEKIIQWLCAILSPYPLPSLSVSEALNAFEPKALGLMNQSVQMIREQRGWMINALNRLGIVDRVWASQANFVLVKFNRPVENACLAEGIVCRNRASGVGMENTMRVSIGTPEENKTLINLLTRLDEIKKIKDPCPPIKQ